MEDIDLDQSACQSTPVPSPLTPINFGNNPSLEQSRHNPDNGVAKFIAELLSKPRPDGSVVIAADKVKDLSSLLGIGKLNTSIDNINLRLDSIERAIKAVAAPVAAPISVPVNPQVPPNGWANVVKKSVNNVPMRVVPRLPPVNRVINEFKPSFFVIRKTLPESRPFFQMSPDQITKKVNQILREINAKTLDNTPIIIKGSATLPSGDFKFFTQTRFAASWLLENKHKWTHLCDPNLVTPPSTFPVILHSVPTTFSPTNPASILDLCNENEIVQQDIHSVRWLGNPVTNKQTHGSIVIHFLNKELAKKIEKGSLFYYGLCFTGAHYKKSPIQCFQCLEIGHTAHTCKNSPLCKCCGGDHNSRECEADFETERCVRCVQNELRKNPDFDMSQNNVLFHHSPTSIKCPLKTRNFNRTNTINQ
jgi:hypothetical protein